MAGVWPDKARERLGRIFWFCFRSVARTDRMVQKTEAPCGVRKAPEIFDGSPLVARASHP